GVSPAVALFSRLKVREKNTVPEFGRLLLGQGFPRRLSFLCSAFQLFQSLLRFCRQWPVRQDPQILFIMSARFVWLIEFLETLGHSEVCNRVIRLPDQCLLIAVERGAIVFPFEIEIPNFN